MAPPKDLLVLIMEDMRSDERIQDTLTFERCFESAWNKHKQLRNIWQPHPSQSRTDAHAAGSLRLRHNVGGEWRHEQMGSVAKPQAMRQTMRLVYKQLYGDDLPAAPAVNPPLSNEAGPMARPMAGSMASDTTMDETSMDYSSSTSLAASNSAASNSTFDLGLGADAAQLAQLQQLHVTVESQEQFLLTMKRQHASLEAALTSNIEHLKSQASSLQNDIKRCRSGSSTSTASAVNRAGSPPLASL